MLNTSEHKGPEVENLYRLEEKVSRKTLMEIKRSKTDDAIGWRIEIIILYLEINSRNGHL